MHTLHQQLDYLESQIPLGSTLNKKVSQATVAWHIEHSLLVLDNSIDFIAKSNPEEYRWSFNFTRIMVFAMNKFPRGKAKAPKSVRPEANIAVIDLSRHIASTRPKLDILKTLSKRNYMKHPFFGNINLKQTIRFLNIHTNHHIAIIEDILKK